MDSYINVIKNIVIRLYEDVSKKRTMPFLDSITRLFSESSVSDRFVLIVLSVLLFISFIGVLLTLREVITAEVPIRGGSFEEGVIGSPRFVNPLLAVTDTDRDLTSLIYTGLLRATPNNGLVLDMAKRFEVSEDGTIYSFVLRDDARFHDGHAVTADDIIFTINMAKEPLLKSAKRADWDGVSVEKINDREIKFLLSKPFAPFLENTTIGILPKHLWDQFSPQEIQFSTLNIKPIGSGPFAINSVSTNAAGIPSRYDLIAHDDYTLGSPKLLSFGVRFFSNETDLLSALHSGAINGASGLSPTPNLRNELDFLNLYNGISPRIFSVYLNQNKYRPFADMLVRKALERAVDREEIVRVALSGFGVAIDSPLPPHISERNNNKKSSDAAKEARILLQDAGYSFDERTGVWAKKDQELRITITTVNVPELKIATELVAKSWRAIGIPTTVSVFETSDLTGILRSREFDSLLFGTVLGREPDLFAFWHSSQRDDPGLNIGMYTNPAADKLLEEARKSTNQKTRSSLMSKIEKEIKNDVPAIFLYSPDYLYAVQKGVGGIDLKIVAIPSERFGNVHEWFRETERVWHFLDFDRTYQKNL